MPMRAHHRSAAMLVLAALFLAACDDSETAETEPPPKPIAWVAAERAENAAIRTLPGVVRATQRTALSFEVAGRVEDVMVDVGDHFERGDVLAVLDADTYRLTVQERASELAEARAELAEAENDHDRQLQLHEQGWVAKAAYDLALSARNSAMSRAETARARLAIAEEDLDDTVLEAPFVGTVAERLIEPSQRVGEGETTFELQGNSGGLEVSVAAPETLVDRLDYGTEHKVIFPARPDLELRGVVTEIGTRASRGNAFPLTLQLEDAPSDMRSGVTAEVLFGLSSGEAAADLVVIPSTAFLAAEGETTIAFVVDEATETLQRREIEVFDLTGNRALVSQGLEPGEIIAAKGLPFLQDGQKIARLGIGPERYNP